MRSSPPASVVRGVPVSAPRARATATSANGAASAAVAPSAPAARAEVAHLRREYQALRAQAQKLAGAPGAIAQRATILWSLYADSKGNHTFPLVAAHGALWADRHFDRTGPIAELTAIRYFYSRPERDKRMKMLDAFSEGFQDANRSVFIDTYANYWFTKRFGQQPGADAVIPSTLLAALNGAHHAARTGRPLTEAQKRSVYETALHFEQESTVSPKVQALVKDFDCPILRMLALKPWVRFTYFPSRKLFFFDDFSSKQERVRYALRARDLASKAGWKKVEAAMRDYGVLPQPFLSDRARYAESLRTQLLSR